MASTETQTVPVEIRSRWTGAVLFTAHVDAGVPPGDRVRAALQVAVQAHADLADANLAHADLADANLAHADLAGANLARADLARANLAGANLAGAYLARANLAHANLAHANLAHADLAHADLADANLAHADLADANLAHADLAGANLAHADLARANLAHAYLARADLARANLARANLAHANLAGASGLSLERAYPLAMLRYQPGPIRLFKVLTERGEGHINGGLVYPMGEVVEVPTANTDPGEMCGPGIHVATLDWCLREWRPGLTIGVVEFTAADIACIPLGTDGKLRLFRCRRVEDIPQAEIDRMLGREVTEVAEA